MRTAARRATALLAVLALLAGCGGGGGQLRDYVAATYDVVSADGDNLEARTDGSVQTVTDDLTGRFDPRDRYDEDTGTFFRHDDDFVAVRPDPAGGTLISVDSDEAGSTRWVPFIGPIFLPGGRFGGPRIGSGGAANGGTGETNRGGGPGTGK